MMHRMQIQKRMISNAVKFIGEFDIVILPWLNTKQLFQSKGLDKYSKRRMALVTHSLIRIKLMHYKARNGVNSTRGNGIHWVKECFSTCMCSSCHKRNGYIGRGKLFICPNKNCKRVTRNRQGFIGRDPNAAVNIWFLWLVNDTLRILESNKKRGN